MAPDRIGGAENDVEDRGSTYHKAGACPGVLGGQRQGTLFSFLPRIAFVTMMMLMVFGRATGGAVGFRADERNENTPERADRKILSQRAALFLPPLPSPTIMIELND